MREREREREREEKSKLTFLVLVLMTGAVNGDLMNLVGRVEDDLIWAVDLFFPLSLGVWG